MIDIHSHVLPKIDDGPNSWEDTLAMLRQGEADGITEVAITHHIVSNMDYRREPEIIVKFRELQERLPIEGINIKVHLGAEIYAQPDMELFHTISTYNDNKKYFLIEFPMQGVPKFAAEKFFDLIMGGLVPIIAHPERNLGIIRNPHRAYEFVQRGALLQMNAGSILGRHGESVKDTAKLLLESNLIHFVGSDGHNTRGRPLKMRDAREAVAKGWGEERADLLFHKNPKRALRGEPITISEPLPVEIQKSSGLRNPIKMIKRLLNEIKQ